MKLLNVELSTNMHKMSLDALGHLVEETVTNLKAIESLQNALYTTSEAMSNNLDPDTVSDDILDEIEIAQMELAYPYLAEYTEGYCAPTAVISRRAENGLGYMAPLVDAVNNFSDNAIPLTDKQVTDLKVLVERTLAELSYFLFYGFLLEQTEKSLKEGKELVMTVPVQFYLDNSGQSAEYLIGFVREIMSRYKPELNALDAFPTLGEEFYSAVGSSLPDFEAYADFISPDLILGVVEGKIEVEDAIKELQQLSSEQE